MRCIDTASFPNRSARVLLIGDNRPYHNVALGNCGPYRQDLLEASLRQIGVTHCLS
jgi:hypothetical protein